MMKVSLDSIKVSRGYSAVGIAVALPIIAEGVLDVLSGLYGIETYGSQVSRGIASEPNFLMRGYLWIRMQLPPTDLFYSE